LVEPCATTHVSPAQQSAFVVQEPQFLTQAPPWKHWKPPPSTGTHGGARPPSGAQQSAAVTHDPPGWTQLKPVHRGTPTLSGWQESTCSQLPEQQSQGCPHAMFFSLQTWPFGWQVCPASAWFIDCVQRPMVDPVGMEQAPACEPQQSESCRHRSPVTWQPLAGWQTSRPVGPNGAQSALQQLPPQAMAPESVTMPPQTVPSTMQPPVPEAVGGAPQYPYAPPVTAMHEPLQQSALEPHVSPVCWQ
jgi:hypothetical protein